MLGSPAYYNLIEVSQIVAINNSGNIITVIFNILLQVQIVNWLFITLLTTIHTAICIIRFYHSFYWLKHLQRPLGISCPNQLLTVQTYLQSNKSDITNHHEQVIETYYSTINMVTITINNKMLYTANISVVSNKGIVSNLLLNFSKHTKSKLITVIATV